MKYSTAYGLTRNHWVSKSLSKESNSNDYSQKEEKEELKLEEEYV